MSSCRSRERCTKEIDAASRYKCKSSALHNNCESRIDAVSNICSISLFLVAVLCLFSASIHPCSAQSNDNHFITVEVGMDVCHSPTAMLMDDFGSMYLYCSSGIIRKSDSGSFFLLHNSTACGTGGSMTIDPTTGTLYASCDGEGIVQIKGNVSTTVAKPAGCSTIVAFAEATISNNFLIGRCSEGGLIRMNLDNFHIDSLVSANDCPGSATGIVYYSENGHDYVVAGCDDPPLLIRLNLTDGSRLSINGGPDQCSWPSSIVRDSDTELLWVACLNSGAVVQVNGTNITAVITNDCDYPRHLRYDPQTGIRFIACQYSGVIAFLDDHVTPVVEINQYASPYFTAGTNGAVLVGCLDGGLIRVPSVTVSTVVSESSCSNAQIVVENEVSGAIVSACQEGVIVTQNTVDTVLLNGSYCTYYFNGLTLRGGYLFGFCVNHLFVYDAFTYRQLWFIDVSTQACGALESYYPDPSFDIIYLHCMPGGLMAFNMTSGISRPLLPYQPYGTSYSMDKDANSNSLYLSFASSVYGLARYDLTSGRLTTLINETVCQDVRSVHLGDTGVIYANCYENEENTFILRLNGSTVAPLAVDGQCASSHVSAQSYDHVTQTLVVSCRPDVGIFAVNVSTSVWTLIDSIEQCPEPSDATYFQDSKTLAVYVPCGPSGAQVSSRDFRCQSGSMWSISGECVTCRPQTYRSPNNLRPFGKCLPCTDGYVAPEVGSSYCTPCAPGTYESRKTCFLCPSGKYQPANASTSCIDCPLGQYAIHPGSTACTMCDPGFYADTKGTVSCFPCTSGSASNITGLDRSCDGCPPGSYQAGIGQTSCFACPAHSYAQKSNSTSCTSCANRVNEARTSCTLVVCDPNEQFNEITGECDLCPLSEYSSRGGLCSTCISQTYTPAAGSGCAPCEGIAGLQCFGGLAQVMPGWWAYVSTAPEAKWTPINANSSSQQQSYQLYRTAPCPFCLGTTLQVTPMTGNNGSSVGNGSLSDSIQYCAFPRLNSVNNTLCGICAEGYLAWGASCVSCTQANAGLIVAYLVVSFALVLFLFYSATNPSSAGLLSIFLFFIQTAALEMGPVVQFLDWIQVVVNLDPKSAPSCLAPWTAYEQTLFALLVPIILIGELIIVAAVHFACYKYIFNGSNSNSTSMDVSMSSSTYRFSHLEERSVSNKVLDLFIMRLRRFSIDDYYVGVLAILLFCYTQVSTASLRYLHCLDVEEQRLNFSAPTIDCKSTEYKQYLIPVLLAIVLYIVGLPLGAGIKLWRNRHSLYMSAADAKRADASVQAFLHRWAPMYAMFHVRAWFWHCWVLLRRAAFVVTAVLLMHQNSYRFMVFAFLHFASLLLHQYVKPYESDKLNRVETVSYVLLVSISLILTGISPPYTLGVQLLLFAMVVPPAIWMVGDVVWQRLQSWRKRIREKRNKQQQTSTHVSALATVLPSQAGFPSRRNIELLSVPMSSDADALDEQKEVPVNESIVPYYALSDDEQHM